MFFGVLPPHGAAIFGFCHRTERRFFVFATARSSDFLFLPLYGVAIFGFSHHTERRILVLATTHVRVRTYVYVRVRTRTYANVRERTLFKCFFGVARVFVGCPSMSGSGHDHLCKQ